MDQIFIFRDIDYVTIARVSLAFVLGGLVGLERESARRPAGLRTHMLVAAGCACFTVASVYGFDNMGTPPDPSRVAAQIVTGVGFLGAGAIFRTESAVRGLTTASSIWITASIGVTAGLGMFWLAVFTTALTWFALRVVKVAEGMRRRRRLRAGPSPSASPGEDQDDEEEG
ncbi:MAG: MgtC/SapB family protein [Chloroflexia bacterium]